MKLIDILVEELPKRGGWMEGVEHAWCDPDGEIRFRNGGCKPDFYPETDVDIEFRVPDSSCEDDSRYIITREQYEAALAAKNDGWIEWVGGDCPVDGDAVVEVKYRNPGPCHINNSPACYFSWSHQNGDDGDIIAYRLHQPQEAELAEADDEADLNECIGQDAAPAWNGECLPPVGCECEYSLNGGKTWWNCKIDYIVGTQGVVMLCDTFEGVQYVQFSSYGNALKFRPTRSEAELKHDAAVEAIDRYMPEFIPDTPNDYYNAKKIYDAIAAGKIPGVKLDD